MGSERRSGEASGGDRVGGERHRRLLREHNKDPRVKVGAFDVSKVSKFEVTFGGMAYKAHACLGCHMIEENGKLIGGPQSAALQKPDSGTTRTGCFVSGRIRRTSSPIAANFWLTRQSRNCAR